MCLLVFIACVCLLTAGQGVPVWTTDTPTTAKSTGGALTNPTSTIELLIAPKNSTAQHDSRFELFCKAYGGALTNPTSTIELLIAPKNSIAQHDSRFELFCKAYGDGRIRIKWYHDGKKMARRGENYRILPAGTLRFIKVKVADRGVYRCKAQNEYKDVVISDPAVLIVHAPAEITNKAELRQTRIWAVGSTRHLVCKAAGIPFPTIHWERDGELIHPEMAEVLENQTDTNTSLVTLTSRLTVKATNSATYTCWTSNFAGEVESNDSISIEVNTVQPSATMKTSTTFFAQFLPTSLRRYFARIRLDHIHRLMEENTTAEHKSRMNEQLNLWILCQTCACVWPLGDVKGISLQNVHTSAS
ncbi:muscle, skeletal receptor tyrosine protein kinase-like [Plakobranchus ocellatus]|uniref:Muscle, skeletal receptor tyrosine protein kinase-like n=1 Tax=Plakobranchus ocellatus TaxID=259542 RepID=A0AAV3ZLY5_9GAST|nr:muscle, skeletal receptor tyrosine protein kinase-like [Plakobranchus ocellatus]